MWLTSRSGSFFSWQNRCPTRTWWGITAKKFRSQSMTPLLRPVVPEVNISTISSSGWMQFTSSAGS